MLFVKNPFDKMLFCVSVSFKLIFTTGIGNPPLLKRFTDLASILTSRSFSIISDSDSKIGTSLAITEMESSFFSNGSRRIDDSPKTLGFNWLFYLSTCSLLKSLSPIRP